MSLLSKYQAYFNEIDALYDYQEKVLESLSTRNNTLAIIPTGGGKSLIYQLLALDQPGITIVISPLLALMEEQVNELNKRGIDALALNSNLSFDEQRKLLRSLSQTDIKLLYLSPERLQNGIFRASLAASGVKISMVAIDEAHCISQWGQSFRPDYAQIKPFIDFLVTLGHKPVVFALTATLAQEARKAIRQEFQIESAHCILPETVIRKNLKLHFLKVDKEKEKPEKLHDFLKKYKPQKALAYLYSKPKCEEYAQQFSEYGYRTAFYHADVNKSDKEQAHSNFLNGQVDILFATTAFGMGINIPDIDAVIHLQIPNSVEEYYQHVGRGWRDKKNQQACQCLALWSETNFDRRKKDALARKHDLEGLKKVIENLLGKPKREGQIIAKDKEEYLKASDNLPLIRYKLEEKKIIKTIGEINGAPLTIQMYRNTELWEELLSAVDGLNSFVFGAQQMGISLSEIIDHLYEQEYSGNIKKLPAQRRDLFFEILDSQPEDEVLENIALELNGYVDQIIANLEELRQLFVCQEPEKIIHKLLS